MAKRPLSNERKTKEDNQAHSPKTHKTGLLVLAIAALAVLAVGLNLAGLWPGQGARAASPASRQPVDGAYTYPQSLFTDGKARHFKHVEGDTEIRYFVLRSGDGVIRAAFDACDVCWPENKGYAQDGEAMVCRNCGRRFASTKINEVQGGCNPAPLIRTIENDQVRIQVADIRNGAGYFNFTGKRG